MGDAPLPARRALVLGASSVLAQALARQLAGRGWSLVLAGRHPQQLEPVAADLKLRHGCGAVVWPFDAEDLGAHADLPDRLAAAGADFDLAVAVFGYLGDQQRVRRDTDEMARTLNVNFVGAAVVLGHIANYLERRPGRRGIIAISSVAGDRGRQSNYFYGAAKGGLSLYLQGLRNRLAPAGVQVLTVKPGFIDTPMTEDVEGLFLVASPDRVATDVLRAWDRGRDVIYTPWFWRYILLVIRLIPERVFKRLRL
ncbi:MAG: SDR family oxidoreductase [Gemmatimonadota bacterium]